VGESMAGECGREVRDAEGADGWGPQGREKECVRAEKKRRRQVGPAEQRERERDTHTERERVGADRRDPPVRHRGHAGACARLGLMGRLGLKLLFYFPGNL
jgi:hypothetical protein